MLFGWGVCYHWQAADLDWHGSGGRRCVAMDHLLYEPPPPPEPPQLTRLSPPAPQSARASALAKRWAPLFARLTRWIGPEAQA